MHHHAGEERDQPEKASPTAPRHTKGGLRNKPEQQRYRGKKNQQGTAPLQPPPSPRRLHLEVEPQHKIHQRGSQQVDVPGNIHHADF
jgi:hypothetical protein